MARKKKTPPKPDTATKKKPTKATITTTTATKATATKPKPSGDKAEAFHDALEDEAVVAIHDCRLPLGRSGAEAVEFVLPELLAMPGERLALVGPSGCGKSTLLNIASGLARPASGTVRVAGEDLGRLSNAKLDALRGRKIGFIYQSFNLLEAFSALENVLIGMRFGRAIPRSERHEQAKALLERVGLGKRLHSKPAKLSAGERQRVAVARAVANKPALLLADEPTGALDPAISKNVFELILEVCDEMGCALLFVTHDHALAERLPRRFDCEGLIVHKPLPGAKEAAA